MTNHTIDAEDYKAAAEVIMSSEAYPSRRLPPDFDRWLDFGERSDRFEERYPLVALAIEYNYPIPSGLWRQEFRKGFSSVTFAHLAASKGYKFEEDFDLWGMKDSRGKPVVNCLIEAGHAPPASFNQWRLKDSENNYTAHLYLSCLERALPKNFDAWLLKDRDGITVAQKAIEFSYRKKDDAIGRLPDNRIIWLTKPVGHSTLLHLRAMYGGTVPNIFSLSDYHMLSRRGETVIDLAKKSGNTQLISQYEAVRMARDINKSIEDVSLPRSASIGRRMSI